MVVDSVDVERQSVWLALTYTLGDEPYEATSLPLPPRDSQAGGRAKRGRRGGGARLKEWWGK